MRQASGLDFVIWNGPELEVLLVGVTGLLVVVAFITAGSDRDSLGSPLWPRLVSSGTPFVIFGAPLGALADRFEWHPSTVARGRISVALD
jgi:hypothetical protein